MNFSAWKVTLPALEKCISMGGNIQKKKSMKGEKLNYQQYENANILKESTYEQKI